MAEDKNPARDAPSSPPLLSVKEQACALIDRWHFESFAATAVARDTEVWNIVQRAKEALKEHLAPFFKD